MASSSSMSSILIYDSYSNFEHLLKYASLLKYKCSIDNSSGVSSLLRAKEELDVTIQQISQVIREKESIENGPAVRTLQDKLSDLQAKVFLNPYDQSFKNELEKTSKKYDDLIAFTVGKDELEDKRNSLQEQADSINALIVILQLSGVDKHTDSKEKKEQVSEEGVTPKESSATHDEEQKVEASVRKRKASPTKTTPATSSKVHVVATSSGLKKAVGASTKATKFSTSPPLMPKITSIPLKKWKNLIRTAGLSKESFQSQLEKMSAEQLNQTIKGWTFLHILATKKDPEALKIFLATNPDVNVHATVNGWNALHLLAYYMPPDIDQDVANRMVAILVEYGLDINGPKGHPPINEAASYGNVKAVIAFVNNGADFQSFDSTGLTPLHEAAGSSHPKGLEVMQFLLKRNPEQANVLSRDGVPSYPIAWAADCNHLERVALLSTIPGPALTFRDCNGKTYQDYL